MKKQLKFLLALFIWVGLFNNANAQEAFHNITSGDGNGVRFWGGNNSYKIHMGNLSDYHYGPVTDYSIKTNMSTQSGRGWTWGVDGSTPIAALSNLGHMQIAGNFTLENSKYLYLGSVNDRIKADNGNIGIYPNANLYIGAVVGGAEIKNVTFLENGNVGIGTTSPEDKLQVESTSYDNIFSVKRDNVSNGNTFDFRITSNPYGPTTILNSRSLTLMPEFAADFAVVTDPSTSTTQLVVKSNGNVGIGTTGPSAKLDVKLSTDTDFLRIRRNSAGGRSQLVLADESANQIWRFGTTGSGNNDFAFYDGTQNALTLEQNGDAYFNPAGNVGIGTTTPDRQLQVENSSNAIFNLKGANTGISRLEFGDSDDLDVGMVNYTHTDNSMGFITNAGTRMTIDSNGNVGIGTTSPATGYKLSVAGKIISEEVNVQLQSAWPDYVFSKNYKLKSLAETESYIKEEGHLPNMPSAQEVSENGIELGEMNAKLLEKIEELTLHLIEQNSRLESQQKRIEELECKVAK